MWAGNIKSGAKQPRLSKLFSTLQYFIQLGFDSCPYSIHLSFSNAEDAYADENT